MLWFCVLGGSWRVKLGGGDSVAERALRIDPSGGKGRGFERIFFPSFPKADKTNPFI